MQKINWVVFATSVIHTQTRAGHYILGGNYRYR